jgi:hypothetical protein
MIARKPSPKRPGRPDNPFPAVEPDEGIESTPEAARLLLDLRPELRHGSKIPTPAAGEAPGGV